jgi:hypothetical protein
VFDSGLVEDLGSSIIIWVDRQIIVSVTSHDNNLTCPICNTTTRDLNKSLCKSSTLVVRSMQIIVSYICISRAPITSDPPMNNGVDT